MGSHFHHYNKNLQPFANRLRNEGTKAEACLWKYVLRAGTLKGFPFRRQRPVLKYIADFMCMDLMLIIEVDGSIHNLQEHYERDMIRQKALESAGYTVLRFTNEEVLKNIGEVRRVLEEWVESKSGRVLPPPL
jgi:very-short-patch-repair endonuclease